MIRRRRVTGRDVIAGLFPELREGMYTVWGLSDNGPIGEVTIVGGQISEFHGGDCGADGDMGEAVSGSHHHHGSHAHSHL
jgi:hypothetical protein